MISLVQDGGMKRVAMRVPEAAEWIGVSETTLRKAIKAEQFPARRIGRTIWISPAAVEKWFMESDE